MDYLEHGISWPKVERMIADSPQIRDDDDDDYRGEITDDNAEEILKQLNKSI